MKAMIKVWGVGFYSIPFCSFFGKLRIWYDIAVNSPAKQLLLESLTRQCIRGHETGNPQS